MNKLKEFRLKNDYTQRYVAYKIGVSQQAVVKWEKGQSVPNISHIIMLSSLMNCSIDELIKSIK
ncbi:MAG: helix-turn-helix transcriptional regulator [Acutalibacteraceae bacterium]|nr:helix-turn-helix transcriptional regulator [Acutalibacteraceae bacterium]